MRHDPDLDAIIAAQPGKNGRLKLEPKFAFTLVVSIVGWLVMVMLAYGAFNTRVAVLEMRQQENDRRLESIEQKIDLLLRRP